MNIDEEDDPRETVSVRGLRNRERRVSVLGTGAELGHRVTGGPHEVPGVAWLGAPAAGDADAGEYATVLAVELDGEPDLYRGTGRS
ncbi:hypothetical protein ADK64_40650 [Streptomyces sp. MMG1121]|nr:hypothetical protein ADK64_40650 [Streptomyces sp. MMG1121]